MRGLYFVALITLTVLSINNVDAKGLFKKSELKPLVPSESYKHKVVLDEDNKDQYVLFWNYDDEEIQFEIHCNTTGWVGLGISPNGGMKGADIALGWVDSCGVAHSRDCYATGTSKPQVDDKEDWILLDGAEVNGYTILKYKRKLATCDESHDVEIKIGTVYLIAAWNDKEPETGDNDWEYHGRNNRGTKVTILLNYRTDSIEEQNTLPSDVKEYELKMPNIKIGAKDTFYYCDLFELPVFEQDTHLIQFEMMVNKTNKKFVHHLLGYECAEDFVPYETLGRECGPEPIPGYISSSCFSKLIVAWAVGGDYKYTFPKQAGYLFKASTKKRYMLLEMHYDNPEVESDRLDNSGVKLFFTKQLREEDLGVINLGAPILQIPPQVDSIIMSTICYPECTQTFFPKDGINVMLGMLHTHLAGRSVRTSIVRKDKMIGYLFDNQNYDFNYQYTIDIEPIKLYKGDALITECSYNTKDRNKFTMFGYGTREEMCINFIYYYPKIPNFDLCQSHPSPQAMQDFYIKIMNDGLIDKLPIDQDLWTTVYQFFNYMSNNATFTSQLIQKYKDFYNNKHNKTFYCGSLLDAENGLIYKENEPDLVPSEYVIEPSKCENVTNGVEEWKRLAADFRKQRMVQSRLTCGVTKLSTNTIFYKLLIILNVFSLRYFF